jgi:hypothetical protein
LQGRKKNASASGVTVGGVAGAAAQAQLQAAAKKDSTHNDFYRFQQRESRRNGGCWLWWVLARVVVGAGAAGLLAVLLQIIGPCVTASIARLLPTS